MNFWLLAFGIGYPPKIKHPEAPKASKGSFTGDIVNFYGPMANVFLHNCCLYSSRVRGPLDTRRLPLTRVDAGEHPSVESRPRSS